MRAGYQQWHSSPWFATWLRLAYHVALLLACAWSVQGAAYYVATTGSAVNPGTLAQPLSLAKAISNTSPAVAGDTIYVRGGTYYSTNSPEGNGFFASLAGTQGNPINVLPYGNEKPIIQATATNHYCMFITGSNTVYRGFEMWNSGLPRASRNPGIIARSVGVKIVNNIIHDVGVALYVGEESVGAEVYGNLIYNYGDEDTSNGQKHAIYAHSTSPGTLIKDNITVNGFGCGIQCYSEIDGQLNNFNILGNICAESGSLIGTMDTNQPETRVANILLGGAFAADGAQVSQNMGYFRVGSADNLRLGYGTTENGSATVTSNYFGGAGTFTVNRWTNLTFTANTFIQPVTLFHYNPSTAATGYTWDGNEYQSPFDTPFLIDSTPKSWATWKAATGFDSSSTFTTNTPTGTRVFVRANSYETGRGNVAVYNWAGTDNVSVDLSSVCQSGRAYTVKNAANYYGPTVKTFAYSGSAVSLPMTNLTVATPVGGSAPSATGPTFNAFIIEPTATIKTRGFLRKR